MVMALDDLQEESGAILDRLGEDLQQVPILIKVNQDVQFLDLTRERERGRERE